MNPNRAIAHEIDENKLKEEILFKSFNKRWLILAIFSSISMMNAFHWIQHNIIQDIIISYYNQSLPEGFVAKNDAVNWLSMIYMLSYIIFVFPAMFILDQKGLKLSVTIGALLTSIGAWVKCAAVYPNRFGVLMLGQGLCAVAQAFTLGVPARLSSIWFKPTELSLATSIGVFGNQLGTAIGFLIPPSVIPNNKPIELISIRFYYLYIIAASFCTLLFVLCLIC